VRRLFRVLVAEDLEEGEEHEELHTDEVGVHFDAEK